MSEKKQRTLKNILISPRYQGRMAALVFFAGLACAALNAYLYYSYVVDSYDFIFRYSSMPRDVIDARYRDLYTFGAALGVITVLLLLLVVSWVLIMTHRAAGAVYHMKKVVDEIRAGNHEARVHLRERDEFQDFAESLNKMLDERQKTT
jgi:nitrogen fixation/metabolism regulation signal transduction histidine kinase